MSRSAPAPAALPPLYDGWMRAFLGHAVAGEPLATCADCAMCESASERPALPVDGGAMTFDPAVKCCTFQPELWNFLVGLALADPSDGAVPGRESLRARLRESETATPLGLGRSRRYQLLYAEGREGFGLSRSMRCPHYLDDGRCGVWRYRESTCATWFCKHERGAVGKRFWMRLKEALTACEAAVARHAVLTLDIGPDALGALLPSHAPEPRRLDASDLDGHRDPARHQALWGRWAGREEEFYIACGRVVRDLSWKDVRRLGGAELEARLVLLEAADDARASAGLADRLTVQPISLAPTRQGAPGFVQLVSYSGYDPLEVPEVVMSALTYFDGRPTAAALRDVEQALGVRLERALLRRLCDFGVLAPAAPTTP